MAHPTEMDLQSTSPEEITRRVPQFENEHVEVWKSIIMPNQPLTMHRHDDPRALIALTGGTLRVVNQDGDAHDMTWEAGSAYWLEADPPGELHGDVNEERNQWRLSWCSSKVSVLAEADRPCVRRLSSRTGRTEDRVVRMPSSPRPTQ